MTSYKVADNILEIPEIEYDKKGIPIERSPVALYHSVTGDIAILSKEEMDSWHSLESVDISSSQVKPSFIEDLLKYKFLVKSESDSRIRYNFSPTSSELYVQLTEGCNFSCGGCATSADLIPPAEARYIDFGFLDFLIERYVESSVEKGYLEMKIKWAGGEPLLGRARILIEQSQELIQGLLKRYENIEINQTILTNGVFINKKLIDFAKEHNIHVSVSLWGTAKYQDKLRRPRNKQETFPIIIENIRQLHEAGVSYNVNYVLTPGNAEDFSDFITQMWDVEHPSFVAKNWMDPRPVPLGINFFRPQSKISQQGLVRMYQKIEEGFRAGLINIHSMIERGVGLRQNLAKVDYLDLTDPKITICGSGFNYVAIGPKGVAACHEGLYEMQENLDRLKKGENMFEIANGEFFKDQDYQFLYGDNVDFGDKSLGFLGWHGGQGCPRLRHKEGDGVITQAVASTSKLYANIYKELLGLEVMRLKRLYRLV